MASLLNKRRLLWSTVAALTLLGAGVAARFTLTGLVLRSLLQRVGAAEIKFDLVAASPWAVVVENMDFRVRTRTFAARRLTLSRAHWWTPSLGSLRIEQARLPLTIDGSDTNPWSWSTDQNGNVPSVPPRVPLDDISVDGLLIIKAAAVSEQTLTLRIDAHLTAQHVWTGAAMLNGPGLAVQAEGTFHPATQALDFKLPVVALENRDREAVYALIARETGATPDSVRHARARQIATNSRSGVWVQDESGAWRKK